MSNSSPLMQCQKFLTHAFGRLKCVHAGSEHTGQKMQISLSDKHPFVWLRKKIGCIMAVHIKLQFESH